MKACKNCGKQFEPVRAQQVFCCKACTDGFFARKYGEQKRAETAERWAKRAKRVCAHCGREFLPEHALERYCSKGCHDAVKQKRQRDSRRERRKIPMVKVCESCGKEFRPLRLKQRFCCAACCERKRKERAKANREATVRKAEVRRREVPMVRYDGLTEAQAAEIVRLQDSAPQAELWAASKKWNRAQRAFARGRYIRMHSLFGRIWEAR